MLADDEPGEDLAAVAGQLGRFLLLNGQPEEARRYLERALELAEALGLTEIFVQALTTKGSLFEFRNRLREARILLEGALGARARRRLARGRHAGDQQPRRPPRVERPLRRRRSH